MTTATGLPQKGDRVERIDAITKQPRWAGTVIERGSGVNWSLLVRWDHSGREELTVDAGWHWRQGYLRSERKEQR
jgi:hypothetical protein